MAKNPFIFKSPEYDERSSCYVQFGSNYGTGTPQPVGHTGGAKDWNPDLSFVKKLSHGSDTPKEIDLI